MSQLVIKTSELQKLVNIAGSGATNDQLFPKSCMINLTVENNKFIITTTDGYNYLYVYKDIINEDFNTCVKIDQFLKLIPKLTSEFITLDNSDNKLTISSSNCTYIIPVSSDDSGKTIYLENKLKNFIR